MEIVGERMHVSLVGLRVDQACRLLLDTDLAVKEIAHASGFREQGQLGRAFRRRVGVSPTEYRRIFAGSRSGPELPKPPATSLGGPNLTPGPSI